MAHLWPDRVAWLHSIFNLNSPAMINTSKKRLGHVGLDILVAIFETFAGSSNHSTFQLVWLEIKI